MQNGAAPVIPTVIAVLDFVFFPEREVYAKTEIGPGMIDRNKLCGVFRGEIVGPEKQVEPRRANVENGSHGATHIGYRPVEREVQRREGTEVDGGHTLGIGAISAEAGSREHAKGDFVAQDTVFGSDTHGGAKRFGRRLGSRRIEFGESL